MTDENLKLRLLEDPDFKELCRSKNRISILLTLLTFGVYFGFIFLLAFSPAVFKHKITTNITVGIPIGIGVIVLSWVFTGIYVRWANNRYDLLVRNVKAKVANGNDADRHRTA